MNAKIAELAASLQADENLTSRKQLECPLCGRTCDPLFNMKRHCASYTDGKMTAMLTQLESDAQDRECRVLGVIRALYDHDIVMGNHIAKYASRAKTILAKTTRYSPRSTDTGSLFTRMGRKDSKFVLVLDQHGT